MGTLSSSSTINSSYMNQRRIKENVRDEVYFWQMELRRTIARIRLYHLYFFETY